MPLGVVNRRRAALPEHLAGPGGQHRLDEPGRDPESLRATLAVHGDVAYVVGQQGAGPIAASLDVFVSSTQPVRHESLPCVRGQVSVPFAALGLSTDGLVYLVCDVTNSQSSSCRQQTQLAYESVNQGRSWSADNPPPPQPPQGVTAVVGERFAWTSGPDLYLRTGHGQHVSLTDRGHGFSLVGFETNTQGVALGTNGYLWITRNGGTSWSRVTESEGHTLKPQSGENRGMTRHRDRPVTVDDS